MFGMRRQMPDDVTTKELAEALKAAVAYEPPAQHQPQPQPEPKKPVYRSTDEHAAHVEKLIENCKRRRSDIHAQIEALRNEEAQCNQMIDAYTQALNTFSKPLSKYYTQLETPGEAPSNFPPLGKPAAKNVRMVPSAAPTTQPKEQES